MNKIFSLVLIIVVVAVVIVGVLASRNSEPAVKESASPTSSPEVSVSPAVTAVEKEFTIVGTSFKFSVTEMRVKEGDTVKVNFRSEQGFHDWVIDEFNAKTKQLPAGQEETIRFVAGKKGTFEYYCSVGTHRLQGMKGKLIVE